MVKLHTERLEFFSHKSTLILLCVKIYEWKAGNTQYEV